MIYIVLLISWIACGVLGLGIEAMDNKHIKRRDLPLILFGPVSLVVSMCVYCDTEKVIWSKDDKKKKKIKS